MDLMRIARDEATRGCGI